MENKKEKGKQISCWLNNLIELTKEVRKMQSIKRLWIALTLVLFATGTMMAGQVLAADWYDPDWNYRKMITIDSTKVPNTDQYYLPVLINTTDVDWRDTVNGGQVAQSDGGDILFTNSDGTTKLDHEIEKYDPSTGELVAWVAVPIVSASSDTDIYIYYGNTSGGLAEWNITGTWGECGPNNYKMVQHLHETSGTHYDSTSNGNDGTPFGGVTQNTTGQINGADDFDGTDDYIAIQNLNYNTVGQISKLTVCAWFNTSYGGGGSWENWALVDFDRSEYYNFFVYGDTGELGFATTASGTIVDMRGNASANDGQWHFGCAVFNSSQVNDKKIYLDGVLDSQQNAYSTGTKLGTGTTRYGFIGDGSEASTFNGSRNNIHYDGLIDEVRISSTVRSADWIKTSYNNQSSPSTFYTVGSEEALPDLIVSYLSIPKVRKNRRGHIARVFVDYRVMNQGDGDAVASELDFYLSGDTVLDGSDTYVGTVNIPALASGEETHRLLNAKKFKLSRPVSSSGTWYLLGTADAGDDNTENGEENNVTAEVAAGSGR